MKSKVFALVLGLSLVLPLVASANTFVDPVDGVTKDCSLASSPLPQSCTAGNSDPMQLGMPWGATGYDTTTQIAGSVVVDEHGLTYPCIGDSWHGCFDISHTDYYRAQMRETVRQLVAFYGSKVQAIAEFPTFKGWINAQ